MPELSLKSKRSYTPPQSRRRPESRRSRSRSGVGDLKKRNISKVSPKSSGQANLKKRRSSSSSGTTSSSDSDSDGRSTSTSSSSSSGSSSSRTSRSSSSGKSSTSRHRRSGNKINKRPIALSANTISAAAALSKPEASEQVSINQISSTKNAEHAMPNKNLKQDSTGSTNTSKSLPKDSGKSNRESKTSLTKSSNSGNISGTRNTSGRTQSQHSYSSKSQALESSSRKHGYNPKRISGSSSGVHKDTLDRFPNNSNSQSSAAAALVSSGGTGLGKRVSSPISNKMAPKTSAVSQKSNLISENASIVKNSGLSHSSQASESTTIKSVRNIENSGDLNAKSNSVNISESKFDATNHSSEVWRQKIPNKIHITKLTRNVLKVHLDEIFGTFGQIKTIEYPSDRYHPEFGKGYAYVEYENYVNSENSVDVVQKNISEFNKSQDSHSEVTKLAKIMELKKNLSMGKDGYTSSALEAVCQMDGGQIDGQEVFVTLVRPSPPPVVQPPPAAQHAFSRTIHSNINQSSAQSSRRYSRSPRQPPHPPPTRLRSPVTPPGPRGGRRRYSPPPPAPSSARRYLDRGGAPFSNPYRRPSPMTPPRSGFSRSARRPYPSGGPSMGGNRGGRRRSISPSPHQRRPRSRQRTSRSAASSRSRSSPTPPPSRRPTTSEQTSQQKKSFNSAPPKNLPESSNSQAEDKRPESGQNTTFAPGNARNATTARCKSKGSGSSRSSSTSSTSSKPRNPRRV